MLSRLALRGALSQRASLALLARNSSSSSGEVDHIANWEKANKIYFGPERDTKNFPHTVQAEKPPATRLGFIPDTWFQSFYDKTGVTGPYVFGGGLATFLISKELWIVEHGFTEFCTFWLAVYILNRKFGTQLGNYLDKRSDEYVAARWTQPQAASKENAQVVIDQLETAIAQQEGQAMLFEAKQEHVDLQLEAEYRQRLNNVYKEVKKRLDYQLESENTQRRFQQTHMVNWIVDNVIKGITPQQEKDSISKCIQDLKALSARAKAASPATA